MTQTASPPTESASTQTEPAPTRTSAAVLVEAADLAIAAISRYDRPDLVAQLQQTKVRLSNEQLRVLVVGEFKQGKSMLVNGVVGAPVCPVFDDVATSVPTVVRHAETATVTLVRALEADGDPSDRRTERIEVPVETLADHASEAGNPGNRERLTHIEVGVPRQILAGGLELADTPGVGGLSSVPGAATMAALPSADAVLFVSDTSQEYTAPELAFLRQAVGVCPNVACVLTKIDMYPEWRRISEINRGHLKTAGIGADMYAVSSTLRWHAVLNNDAGLNAESGHPALVGYLRRRVVAQADRLARRSTAHDVIRVTGQLASSLRTEHTALRNPESIRELVGELTAAKQRAADLKDRSARWQQTLNDGVADLNADIEYDLRDRLRELVREAEDELSTGDPTKVWDQFSLWVEQQVAAAASANFVWASQRARWLAHQVGQHFAAGRQHVLPPLRTDAGDALRSVRAITMRETEPWSVGNKVLTGLKGGYMGMLMFGMLGTFVGFASLINPLGIGAGLLMSGKTIGDERRRIITRRQNEAKTAVRRYVDDMTFQLGKDSRDRLRTVQRDLRDHFTEQAEQMKRSLQESLKAAESSVQASKREREGRLAEIKVEIDELATVQRQARTLLAPPPVPEVVQS